MFSNMKTATKILLGFVFCIVVSLVVGVNGYTGLSTAQQGVGDIGKNLLPSVVSVDQMVLGQVRVAYAMQVLNSRRTTDLQDRAKVRGILNDGKKLVAEGRQRYEPLARNPEEERVWKEAAPLLTDWERGLVTLDELVMEKDRLLMQSVPVDDPKMKDVDDKIQQHLNTVRDIRLALEKDLNTLVDISVKGGEQSVKEVETSASKGQATMLVVFFCGAGVALVFGVLVSRSIAEALRKLAAEARRLAEAAVAGQLNQRGEVNLVTPEFQPIIVGMNETLDAVIGPLNVSAAYVDRISKGDIPSRITDTYNGDFNTIKNNLNQCIDAVNLMVADAATLAKAAVDGRLATRADASKHFGDYRRIVQGVNDTLDAVIGPLNVSAAYVDRISKGDIPSRITDTYNGDFNTIKNNLNQCIDAVSLMVADAASLTKAAVEGRLATRADASKHQGDYRKIVQGVNETLDAVIGPLNVAANYVDRISKGDIPLRITDTYNGDFNTIKNNINRCVDAVNRMVEDAVTLAKAAVDGRLSTRADASKHEGDFRKIVQGVNETLDAVINPVMEATRVLELLSGYDLTARMDGEYQGDHARIRDALNATGKALHDALCQVADAVEQVSEASRQIASSSQSVAQGSSEQASSLEETSSSLEEMSSMTKQNADNTIQARTLAQTTKEAAERGGQAMVRMTDAMEKIQAASEGTAQIIKDINEIAFQTNLLALNAAVEAARAGDAGRGFAVVAEEVRNLALRSKEAAKKTEDLIKQAVSHSQNGRAITNEVAANLGDIVGAAGKVNDIVSEIAVASQEQSRGIDQVNTAVSEMDKVVQVAAANAEESSSAAEELSSQSEDLAGLVGRFTLTRSQGRRVDRSEAPVRGRGQIAQAPVRRAGAPQRRVAAAAPSNSAASKRRTAEELIPLASDPDFQDF
jgi:methyl-accepting chemotaxis protein